MAGLRVFDDSKGGLLLEITAPELYLGRALFVPAISGTFPNVESHSPDEFVEIRCREMRYWVQYLLVTSRRIPLEALRQVGELEETNSINILNPIVDVFAFPNTRGV